MPDEEPYRDPDTGQAFNAKGEPICGARKTKGKGWCGMKAGYKTDHWGFGPCAAHMGATPSVAKSSYKIMARAMGAPRKIHPAEAMAEQIASTAGLVAWLEQKVGEFRFKEVTKLDDDGVETEQFMTPNQHSWFKIYQEERDRLVRFSEIAIRAGLAERSVRLAEQQGAQMVGAINEILAALQLTEDQARLIPHVVPRALRAIAMEGKE